LKKLIETYIPLSKLNETAKRETSFKIIRFPKLGNLHPYSARRPTAPARISILTSILPSDVDVEETEKALGLDKMSSVPYKLLYLVNPDRMIVEELVKKYTRKSPKDIIIIDPMAGGGSIPLEALRMGFYTIAIEYNPVAYLILKATLEYPAKYGRELYKEVKENVGKLIAWSQKVLSQYYPPDAYNYIVARGYRCPRCQGLIPIIHSTKLGRQGPFIKFEIDKENKTFNVHIVNEETMFERLRCPYCRIPINANIALKDWVRRHKELLNIALDGNIEKAKEKIEELLETHIILVKETPQGFKPADEYDRKLFIKAYLDLTRQANELKEVLPDVQMPEENEVFKPIKELNIEFWYELFSPRQLLVLLKFLKYVRQLTKKSIKEKGEHGVAICLYLALGINKLFNFNNITTTWDDSTSTIRELVDHYSRKRSVGLGLEYCEMPPLVLDPNKSLGWVFEPHVTAIGRTAGGILPVLRLLSEWLAGLSDRVKIYCGNAGKLSEILNGMKVDVVNVDPPYLAQHFYSDLMEFFWQFLRIMLEPAIDEGYLFNRDPKKGRVELFIEGWSPYLYALPREAEIIARKGRDKIADFSSIDVRLVEKQPYTGAWYVLKMWEFFREVYKVLKDDGLLIVWFTHSDPRAWEAIVGSLYAAGFSLSKAWPVWTEMAQRRVALMTSAFFTSLLLVLKKRRPEETIITGERNPSKLIQDESIVNVIRQGVIDALQSAYMSKASGSEMFIMGLAGAIASCTKIWNPQVEVHRVKTLEDFLGKKINPEIERFIASILFFEKVLYPAAIYVGSLVMLEDYMKKLRLSDKMVKEVLFGDRFSQAYLLFWASSRLLGSRELSYDFVEKVCKITNIHHESLVNFGLLRRTRVGGMRTYRVLFGIECYNAVRNVVPVLLRTNAGQAIHLLRFISEHSREDPKRVAKEIKKSLRVSCSAISIATFLLRSAQEDELQLIGASDLIRGFIEDVLKALYSEVCA